ncbi:MAG: hypothetical protein ACP5VE_14505 [Chthonomonadales bacterium]
MSWYPHLTGEGLFRSVRHLTDTVADYFVNEGAGTPRQVYRWFQSLAMAEGKALNTTLPDVAAVCKLLATEFSLEEQPLLVETEPGLFALQNVNAW